MKYAYFRGDCEYGLNEVDTIIVEYPDRLVRFGYNYLKEFTKSLDVSIEVIEQNKKLESNEEMVNDLVRMVTCLVQGYMGQGEEGN